MAFRAFCVTAGHSLAAPVKPFWATKAAIPRPLQRKAQVEPATAAGWTVFALSVPAAVYGARVDWAAASETTERHEETSRVHRLSNERVNIGGLRHNRGRSPRGGHSHESAACGEASCCVKNERPRSICRTARFPFPPVRPTMRSPVRLVPAISAGAV